MNIEYCHDLIGFISMLVCGFREPWYKSIRKRTLHVHSNRNGLLKARQSTVFPLAPLLFKYSHSLAYDILQTKTKKKWFLCVRKFIFAHPRERFINKQLKDSWFPFIVFFIDFIFHMWQAMCLPPSIQTKSSHSCNFTCIEYMQVNVGKIHTIEVSNIEISDNV